MNRSIRILSLILISFSGVSAVLAGPCTEDISTVRAVLDRAEHVKATAHTEQQAALSHGAMRKSTGRDAMEVYDAMTAQVATSGQDTARQSAGKPTIYQEAEAWTAGRLAKAEAALERASIQNAAMNAEGCQTAVTKAKRLLLAR